MGETPALPEVRRRALARFETPAALAELLADRVLSLRNGVPGFGDQVASLAEQVPSQRDQAPNLADQVPSQRDQAPNLADQVPNLADAGLPRSRCGSGGKGFGVPNPADPDPPRPGVRLGRPGERKATDSGLRRPGPGRSSARPCRVVDPTCGSGALLAPLADRGHPTYGVDLDPEAVRRAAIRLGTVPGGRVKVGNALLDPVGPTGWEAFVRAERGLLEELAALRSSSRFEEADALARPVRERLANRLPAILRDQAPFCWPLEFPEVFLEGGFEVVVSNPPWDKLKLHVRECFDPALRELHESEQRSARLAALVKPELRAAIETERQAMAAFRAWLRAGRAAKAIAETGRGTVQSAAGSRTGTGDRSEAMSGRGVGDGSGPTGGCGVGDGSGTIPRRAAGAGPRGDANAYLAVLDLADALLARGGVLGAIVPGGFWTDLSALAWRERLFGEYADVATWCLEARTDAFPEIDQRTAVVTGRKVGTRTGPVSRQHAPSAGHVSTSAEHAPTTAGPASAAEHAPTTAGPASAAEHAPTTAEHASTSGKHAPTTAEHASAAAEHLPAAVRSLVAAKHAPAAALPEGTIAVHPPISRLANLDTTPGFPVPISLIRRTAPESLAIPPLADPLDAAIVEKLYQAGPPFAAGAWQPEFGREIDMTLDADLFDGVRPTRREDTATRAADRDRPAGPGNAARVSPLWEGKRIGAFELCPVDAVATGAWPRCKEACSRADSCPLERRNGQQLWVDESQLGERDRGHARHARVAWRSVARADRARRLEAALIPPGYRLGNSLNYLVGDRHTLDEKLTLLALLNSLVVEWRFRQLANNNNVNLFAIRQLPMPEGADPALAALAGRLMLGDLAGLAGRLMGSRLAPQPARSDLTRPEMGGVTLRAAREAARDELEAAVAHRFGLSGHELARILSGFPKLPPERIAGILSAFDRHPPGANKSIGQPETQASGRLAVRRAR